MDTVITIITSAAFGSIIGAVLIFIQTQQNKSAQYITNERALWRKELKGAIKLLITSWNKSQDEDEKNSMEGIKGIEEALTIIECQLNPYSKYDYDAASSKLSKDTRKQWILEDGHIWDSIECFRSCMDKKNLDSLIAYLQMLLKYDWERSKREIRTNIYIVLMVLLTNIGSLCLTGLAINTSNEHKSTSLTTISNHEAETGNSELIDDEKSYDSELTNNESRDDVDSAEDKTTLYDIISTFLVCFTLFLIPSGFCFFGYCVLSSSPRHNIDCIGVVVTLIMFAITVCAIYNKFGQEIIGVYTWIIYLLLLVIGVFSGTLAFKQQKYCKCVEKFSFQLSNKSRCRK